MGRPLYPNHSMKLVPRFLKAFVPEPNSGCWLWTKNTVAEGYGTIRAWGKNWRAHRVSWVLHYGAIPAGQMVCHRCDNPSCVNPDHLFLGTAKDNASDMVRKNRQARGLRAGRVKITPSIVWLIRTGMVPHSRIEKDYGIKRGQIGRIKRYESWAHLP